MKLTVHMSPVVEERIAASADPAKPGVPYPAALPRQVLLVSDLQAAFSENPPDDIIKAIFAL